MRRLLHRLLTGLLVACLASALAAVSLFFLVHTNWFQAQLRQRVISILQQTTGARVSLRSLRFDLPALTLELEDLVVQGTEPPQAPPLFRAPLVVVKAGILSFAQPRLDVASVVIREPQAYVSVSPSGSTNIPESHGNAYQKLLDLRVQRFELDHARLQVNDKKLSFDAQGGSLKLLLTRTAVREVTRLSLTSKNVLLRYGSSLRSPADIGLSAQLSRDRLEISALSVAAGDSTLQASGILSHLAAPTAVFQVNANLLAADAARIFGFPNLREGEAAFIGRLEYQPSSGFSATGKLHCERVAYRFGSFNLRNVGLGAEVQANAENISLRRLTVTSPLGSLSGSAAIDEYRKLSINAQLAAVDIQPAVLGVTGRSIPWSGLATGHVDLAAVLDSHIRSVSANAHLSISPSAAGIPISGEINAAVPNPNKILFASSQIRLSKTAISFSGVPGDNLQLAVTSGDLYDLRPVFLELGFHTIAGFIPELGHAAGGSFQGSLAGTWKSPVLEGDLGVHQFSLAGQTFDRLQSHIAFQSSGLAWKALTLDAGAQHARANGELALQDWTMWSASPLRLDAQFKDFSLEAPAASRLPLRLPFTGGLASGSLSLAGPVNELAGNGQITINNLNVYGQALNQVQMNAAIAGDEVKLDHGRIQSGPAAVTFSGSYRHLPRTWDQGRLSLRLDSNGFPLRALTPVNNLEPGLDARLEAHAHIAVAIAGEHARPAGADGTLLLHAITLNGADYGNLSITAQTRDANPQGELRGDLRGDLHGSAVHGSLTVQLASPFPMRCDAQLGKLDLETVFSLLRPRQKQVLPLDGSFQANVSFAGPLEDPRHWHSLVRVDTLQLRAPLLRVPGTTEEIPAMLLQNAGPILIEGENATAAIRSFHLTGTDTNLTASGSIGILGSWPLKLNLNGAVDLRAFQLLDSRVASTGQSIISATLSGPLSDPAVTGTLQLRNGSFFLQNVTNGFSAVNGTLLFNRDRATIQSLTAESGGGTIKLDGFVSFGGLGPLVYHLEAHAESVRLRYAASISVTASADLKLNGSSETSIVSGTATVSRVVLSPNTDLGNIVAGFAAPVPAPANQKDFVSGLRFDLGIESAPDLVLSTALSRDVEASIDLRLRGTPDHPIVLGSITANQGDIKVFGTRYSINRGNIAFLNTVKIEPVLDLDLQTETRGITVDITIAGTLHKLNITYRSDPPLQPRDILALLAVGRTPNSGAGVPTAQANSEAAALQSGAYSVLGQAISPSSGRLSKLFGVTNVKIDPVVQGITNTPQARLTLEEQISRDFVVTDVTNLSQTAEQIFRVEWALNRQYSIVALRDDNGEFGIDILYKKRFK